MHYGSRCEALAPNVDPVNCCGAVVLSAREQGKSSLFVHLNLTVIFFLTY